MRYFQISAGLRGCYMPDSAYVIQVKTRRQLKDAIAYEAESYRDAGFIGANKRAISTLAAMAWRNAKNPRTYLPVALPLAPEHSKGNYCHGIFVSSATREEYRAYLADCE